MGYTITGDIDSDAHASSRTHGITTDTLGRSDIVVKNVTVQGFNTDDSAGVHLRTVDNSTITNVHTENNYHGIWLGSSDGMTGSSNITIDQVTATNNARVGILLGEPSLEVVANNNTIRNSIVTNNGGEGVRLAGVTSASGPVDGSSDNRLIGNTITGNGQDGEYGVRVFGGENNEIRGNTIAENARGGVTLLNGADNTTIVGNTVLNHDKSSFVSDRGIYVGYATQTTITDNQIHSNQISIDLGDLTQATDSVITGNEIVGGNSYGIWIRGTATNTTISDNNLSQFSSFEALYVDGASGTSVTNNSVTNGSVGLYFSNAPELTVSDNVVHVTDRAVRLRELSNVSVTNLDIGDSTAANTTISVTTDEMGSNDEIFVYSTVLPPENPDNESIGRYVDIRGDPPLSVEVAYDETDIDGLDESMLSLWKYNGTAWVEVDGSSVETARHVVTAELTNFNSSTPPSTFGVFADPAASRLSVERPTINETAVSVGEDVLVSAVVVNNGSIEGDLVVDLEIDDQVVDSQSVTVAAGDQESVDFVHTFTETGVYSVSVNGVFAGTVTVGQDTADVEYSDLSVSPTEIYTGSSVTVSAIIENNGTSEGNYSAPLVVNGDLVDLEEGILPAGENRTVTFGYQFDVGGSYDVAVGDLSPKTVSVTTAWAQFGFGDNNIGFSEELTGPVLSAEESWNYTAGGQSTDHVRSSPVVADGVVYVGSNNGQIHAVNITTGEPVWTFDVDGMLTSGQAAAVTDGVVYATTAATGTGTVYAIDADAGTEQWSTTIGEPLTSARIVNGLVYVGSDDGTLYAFDASDGSQQWQFDTGRMIRTTPAVSNGVVYVATQPQSGQPDEKIHAVDATTGTELWNADEWALGDAALTVADGTLYAGDFAGNVYAFDVTDGTQLWNTALGGQIQGAPSVANGVVYVGNSDNHVYALNATNGAQVWQFETGGNVRSSPAVTNGAVYVGSYDTNVYGLNAATGNELWQFETGDNVWSSPAVLDGVLYIGSDDGNLYAIADSSGPVVAGTFDVTIDSADRSVTAGETLTVEATIENTGGSADEQLVRLFDTGFTNDEQDSALVALDAGQSTSVVLEWETDTDDVGMGAITVISDDTSDSTTVSVFGGDEPPTIENIDVSPDLTNDQVTINATVEGASSDVKTVRLGLQADFTSFRILKAPASGATNGSLSVTVDVADVVADGTYTGYVRATDELGNKATKTGGSVTVDTTSPVVNTRIENLGTSSATLNITATEQVTLSDLNITAVADGSSENRTPSVSLDTDDTFSIEFDGTKIGSANETTFTSTFDATDEAGNTDRYSVTASLTTYLIENNTATFAPNSSVGLFELNTNVIGGSKSANASISQSNSPSTGTKLAANQSAALFIDVVDIGLDQQAGELTNASVSIPLSEITVPGFDASDLVFFYSASDSANFETIETTIEVIDGQQHLVATVDGFSQLAPGGVDDQPPTIDSTDIAPSSPTDGDEATVSFEYSPVISDIDVSATDATVSGVGSARYDTQITKTTATVEFEELADGETVEIELTVVDTAGNTASETVSFTVGDSGTDNGSSPGSGSGSSSGSASSSTGGTTTPPVEESEDDTDADPADEPPSEDQIVDESEPTADTEDPETTDETPGFGVIVALLAILSIAGISRYHR